MLVTEAIHVAAVASGVSPLAGYTCIAGSLSLAQVRQ